MSIHAEQVAKGVALLDNKVPGWWQHINLDTLQMSDCSQCMLGQLFGHDIETALGAKMFGLPIESKTAKELKTLSVKSMNGIELSDEECEVWQTASGWYRGRGALGLGWGEAIFSVGCGGDPELRCEWAKVIAERRARDAQREHSQSS